MTLIDATPPLTVQGNAIFDGTLFVDRNPGLPTVGSFRLIQVNGDPGGSVFATEILPSSTGLFTFDTLYDADGVSGTHVEKELRRNSTHEFRNTAGKNENNNRHQEFAEHRRRISDGEKRSGQHVT